jgi:hypothetical protein
VTSGSRTPSSVTTESIAAVAMIGVLIGGMLFLSNHGKSGRLFFEMGGSSGFAGLVSIVARISIFGGYPADGLYLLGMVFAFLAGLIAKKI